MPADPAPGDPARVPAGPVAAAREVFDASPIGAACWCVADGRLLYANPVFADLVGRSPGELVGEPFAGFIDPAEEPAVRRSVDELWSGHRNHLDCELRCRDAGGAELWLTARLHAVYGTGGRPACFISQIFTFLGRRAAPSLRPPEAVPAVPAVPGAPGGPAADLLDEVPALVWFAAGGTASTANARVAEFVGPLPEGVDVVGALRDRVHPDDRAAFDERWKACVAALLPFAMTARSRRADGELRWLAHRARPAFGPDGRLTGYAGVSVDVTDERRDRRHVDAELALFRGMAEAGPVPLARTDLTGAVVYANPRWSGFLDDPATRLGGLGWQDLLVPEHVREIGRLAREALPGATPFGLRVRVRDSLALDETTRAAGRRWGDLRAAPVLDAEGRPEGFVVMVADVSGQVAEEQRAARLSEVLEAGTDYVVVEQNGVLTYVNRAAQQELGLAAPGAGDGPLLMDVLVPDSYDHFHHSVRAVLQEARLWSGELVVRHVSGREMPVSVLALAHGDGDRIEAVTVVARDISDLKQAHSRMSELATHDYLTGLPNRVLLYERVDLALSRHKRSGQTVALLFLDLDQFKPINDELGHHVGDAVLVALADRMHEAVRDTDTTARIGGDEFAVLVEGYESVDLLERVAERLIDAVSRPIEVEGTSVRVGVSIGIVAADDATADADVLLSRADAAMYEAKAAGRGRYVFATPVDPGPAPTPGPA